MMMGEVGVGVGALDANLARRPHGLALFLLLWLGSGGIPTAQAAQRPGPGPGPSQGPSVCTRVVLGANSTVHVHYTYMLCTLRALLNKSMA